MTLSLRDYIKKKFIENSFLKEFKGVTTPITNMFVSVGEDFGFGNKQKSSYGYATCEDINGLYFYDVNTKNGLMRLAYLDYIASNNNYTGSSIYCSLDGKLYKYDHFSRIAEPVTVDLLSSDDKVKKYNDYLDYLSKQGRIDNENTNIKYFFIGDDGDKNYYHGSDNKIYVDIKKGSKVALNENTEEFSKYMGIWDSLQKLV